MRETLPSLFLSAEVKFGVLEPDEDEPPIPELPEPVPLAPEEAAAPLLADDGGVDEAPGFLLPDEV